MKICIESICGFCVWEGLDRILWNLQFSFSRWTMGSQKIPPIKQRIRKFVQHKSRNFHSVHYFPISTTNSKLKRDILSCNYTLNSIFCSKHNLLLLKRQTYSAPAHSSYNVKMKLKGSRRRKLKKKTFKLTENLILDSSFTSLRQAAATFDFLSLWFDNPTHNLQFIHIHANYMPRLGGIHRGD